MNKRFRWGYLAAALAAVIFVAFSGYAQEDVKKVDDSAFSHHIRPAVPFAHDAHNEKAGIEDCSTCHHDFNTARSWWEALRKAGRVPSATWLRAIVRWI